MADISAYMAYTSNGNKIELEIPNDEKAMKAYENGKKMYFTKVGQLNFHVLIVMFIKQVQN